MCDIQKLGQFRQHIHRPYHIVTHNLERTYSLSLHSMKLQASLKLSCSVENIVSLLLVYLFRPIEVIPCYTVIPCYKEVLLHM